MRGSGPSSLLWLSMPFSRARDGEWLGGMAAGVKCWGVEKIKIGQKLSRQGCNHWFRRSPINKFSTNSPLLKYTRKKRHQLCQYPKLFQVFRVFKAWETAKACAYLHNPSSTQTEIARTNSGWWVFPGSVFYWLHVKSISINYKEEVGA
jgi:hypothetical protein